MLNICDFETNIVVILFCFDFKKCLFGSWLRHFPHTIPRRVIHERLRHSLPLLTVCVETPNEPVRRDQLGFSDIHSIEKNVRKLPYKEVDVTTLETNSCGWLEVLTWPINAHFLRDTNSTRLHFHIMEKSATKSLNSSHQRTPLGGRKRSRKEHCRKAAESRWKKKEADESLACSQLRESETATFTTSGDAEILSLGNLQAPAEQPNDSCTTRKKNSIWWGGT